MYDWIVASCLRHMFHADSLVKILERFPKVTLGYFFGSRARGDAGPLSDFDFAFYIDEKDAQKRFDLRLELYALISKELRTDKLDIVILNDVKGSELKYQIIKDGECFYEKEPFKVLVEPRILNEYFDFRQSLLKYGLTQA